MLFLSKIILLLIIKNIIVIKASNSFCDNIENFEEIESNSLKKLNVGPKKEYCFKYKLSTNPNKVSLTFMKGHSTFGEVFIYDSLNKIIKDESGYIQYYLKYNIKQEKFKEFNINSDYIFIIIRAAKNYFFLDYVILYESEKNISLKEGEPLVINNFMSNNKYFFSFKSSKDVNIVYSSKGKGQKSINIYINDILDKTITVENEIILNYHKATNNDEYKIIINNHNFDDNSDQKFSIIYYENQEKFRKIKKNENIQINYILMNQKIQYFYFYLNISNYNNTGSVNFKLDYLNKNDKTKYINISSKINLTNIDIDDNSNEAQFNHDFNNELDYYYDVGSDENLKIYFNPNFINNSNDYKYKFILVKVKINNINLDSDIGKSFNISLGNEVENIELNDNDTINYKNLEIKSESYIPSYTKLLFNFNPHNYKGNKYLVNIPYKDYILLVKGDLLTKEGKLNNDYIYDSTDLLLIEEYSEIIVKINGYQANTVINIERLDLNNNIILVNSKEKNFLFKHTYKEEECKPNIVNHIIYKYDIYKYSDGLNNISKYWTSDEYDKNDTSFTLFYKNKISVENKSLFPSYNYQIKKDSLFISNTEIDIFSIKCTLAGKTLYIRPLKKTFGYKTNEIYLNSKDYIKLYSQTEIIQLNYPIENAPTHIYFSLLLLKGEFINLIPDTLDLFQQKILKNSNLFLLEIDTRKFKMDEMAIKIFSEEYCDIEITETSDFEENQYQIISSKKNNKVIKNNIIIFLDENIEKIMINFNKGNISAFYGIVRLPTNNTNYIPRANKFINETIEEIIDEKISLNNSYYKKEDKYKPYQAFILSFNEKDNDIINNNYIIEYEINAISSPNSLNKIVNIILIVSICLSLIILIIFILYMKLANKKNDSESTLDINESDNILLENDYKI